MASHPESLSMALFCDFENVALGVRDAQFEKFDIKPILERLLLKGSIVVKKAYCDWDRYKGFKAAMHEANFELIEIPHVRQSGKNSADIRLVVDALDLCYTKSHVDTFVIISGDSDFSPLVSKLRENAKQVIGVGIKQSTSDLLIANCDEFIFYDDLVRESQRAAARREPRGGQPAARRTAEDDKPRKDDLEARRTKAIELAVATFDALVSERGDSGKMWASVLKEAIKRRRPDFNESYFGFKAFGNLLEAAQQRGLIQVGRDEKSGTYVYRSLADEEGEGGYHLPTSSMEVLDEAAEDKGSRSDAVSTGALASDPRRRGRGGRGNREQGRNESPADTPTTAYPRGGSAGDVTAVSADGDIPSINAGLAAGEGMASAEPQEMGTTAEPNAGSVGAGAATDTPSHDGAARKRPRRGRQGRAARDEVAAGDPAATQAPASGNEIVAMTRDAEAPPVAETQPADRSHTGSDRGGEEAPLQQGDKARARKTRKTKSASDKAAAPASAAQDAGEALAEPAASGSQAPSDAEQAAAQPAKKTAPRKRSGARAAKKAGSAGKSGQAKGAGETQ